MCTKEFGGVLVLPCHCLLMMLTQVLTLDVPILL